MPFVFDVEQMDRFGKVSLACTPKYEAEHSEKSLDIPTLNAVLATYIN